MREKVSAVVGSFFFWKKKKK
ncbi:hypothetical protein CP10743SC13_1682A, partial [Chlamydia psittaci 10_743_SC13]